MDFMDSWGPRSGGIWQDLAASGAILRRSLDPFVSLQDQILRWPQGSVVLGLVLHGIVSLQDQIDDDGDDDDFS